MDDIDAAFSVLRGPHADAADLDGVLDAVFHAAVQQGDDDDIDDSAFDRVFLQAMPSQPAAPTRARRDTAKFSELAGLVNQHCVASVGDEVLVDGNKKAGVDPRTAALSRVLRDALSKPAFLPRARRANAGRCRDIVLRAWLDAQDAGLQAELACLDAQSWFIVSFRFDETKM